MNSTDENKSILTPADICSILKSCGETGVLVLKFQNLYVRFGKKTDDAINMDIDPTPSEKAISELHEQLAELEKLQAKVERDAILAEDVADKEDDLDLLQITDPLEHENMMISGELEHDERSTEET